MDRNVTNSDKCMIPLNYGLEIFPEYLAPKPKIRAPNVGLASPIATEILALENPEIWLFAKMAPKTTSGSGFHFIVEFGVLELIENDIDIDRVCGSMVDVQPAAAEIRRGKKER